jgi:hypothetical protein
MYKIIIYISILVAFIGYFMLSQNKIANLNRQVAQSDSILKGYKEANAILRTSINRQVELLGEVRQANITAEQRAIEALQAFEDSNLNYLSQHKPELIERIINEGTQNVLNEIERITSQ